LLWRTLTFSPTSTFAIDCVLHCGLLRPALRPYPSKPAARKFERVRFGNRPDLTSVPGLSGCGKRRMFRIVHNFLSAQFIYRIAFYLTPELGFTPALKTGAYYRTSAGPIAIPVASLVTIDRRKPCNEESRGGCLVSGAVDGNDCPFRAI
jgi:hypothetical protein